MLPNQRHRRSDVPNADEDLDAAAERSQPVLPGRALLPGSFRGWPRGRPACMFSGGHNIAPYVEYI